MRKIWVGVLIVGLIACSKDDVVLTDVDVTIQNWLDTMNITTAIRDNSGVYYYPVTSNAAGTEVTSGSVVFIYYTLTDLDGNAIASYQRSDGDSLLMKQGVSAVYPLGLDVGLQFMRVGETFNLIIPPSQGYQDLTSGAINPNLISLLQVEVVNVVNEAFIYTQELTDIDNYIIAENLNDTITNPLNTVQQFTSGVAYKRLSRGFGPLVLNGEDVVLRYTGSFLDNTVFEANTNFSFTFGSNEPRPLIPGFEFGVSLMQPNENAMFIIPSSQAYRESAFVLPAFITNDLITDGIIPDYVATVGPYTPLIFNITRFD